MISESRFQTQSVHEAGTRAANNSTLLTNMFEPEKQFGINLPLLDTCSQSTAVSSLTKEMSQLRVFDHHSSIFSLFHQFRKRKSCGWSNTVTKRSNTFIQLQAHLLNRHVCSPNGTYFVVSQEDVVVFRICCLCLTHNFEHVERNEIEVPMFPSESCPFFFCECVHCRHSKRCLEQSTHLRKYSPKHHTILSRRKTFTLSLS